MRPTSLGFRSPKEHTPAGYFPSTTYNGHSLSFKSPKAKNQHFTFATAKRFSQYKDDSRRTGFKVGPGAYSPERNKAKIPGSPIYRKPHRGIGNNGYFYVGEHLVFEPSYAGKDIRKLSMSVDSSTNLADTRPFRHSDYLKRGVLRSSLLTQGRKEFIEHLIQKKFRFKRMT